MAEYHLRSIDKAPKFHDWMYSRVAPYLHDDVLEISSGVGCFNVPGLLGWCLQGNLLMRSKSGEVSAGTFDTLTPMMRIPDNAVLRNLVGASLAGVFGK